MKMAVFWNVAACSMADVSEELIASIIHHPDDEGSQFL
jgi:hypothetical protein